VVVGVAKAYIAVFLSRVKMVGKERKGKALKAE
jgi:hypothetical protein